MQVAELTATVDIDFRQSPKLTEIELIGLLIESLPLLDERARSRVLEYGRSLDRDICTKEKREREAREQLGVTP